MSEKFRVKGTATFREVTPNDVVVGGEIVGSDPDQHIRDSIRRHAERGPIMYFTTETQSVVFLRRGGLGHD